MREYQTLRKCCLCLVLVLSVKSQSGVSTVNNFSKHFILDQLETTAMQAHLVHRTEALTMKTMTSSYSVSVTKMITEKSTFNTSTTKTTHLIPLISITTKPINWGPLNTRSTNVTTITWRPGKRAARKTHATTGAGTLTKPNLVEHFFLDISNASPRASNKSVGSPTNTSGIQLRKNVQTVKCDNNTFFYFHDAFAFEENSEGSHRRHINIDTCETKENTTVNLTLYQFTTGTLPSPFWTDYAVLGFVVKTFPAYWVLYKLHVFAIMRSGDVVELQDVAANTSAAIPFSTGHVHFDSWANFSNRHGPIRFHLNGSVQIGPTSLRSAVAAEVPLEDMPVPLKGSRELTTVATETYKARTRRQGVTRPRKKTSFDKEFFTKSLKMLIGAILSIVFILAVLTLLQELSILFENY